MKVRFFDFDKELQPYTNIIKQRYQKYSERASQLSGNSGVMASHFNNHLYYGLHNYGNEWVIREFAPNATAIFLIGDFNNWEKNNNYSFTNMGGGNWEFRVDTSIFSIGSRFQLLIEWSGGSGTRLPSYARRVVQCDDTKVFYGEVWESNYKWKSGALPRVSNPLIYEVHIGISGEEAKVSTFNEFRTEILPKIVDLGYNAIQIMGVQEHPYYGSFGYQVSNFFAVSSRFGTPDDLKELIDEAHGYGVAVLMDIVHSHSVNNIEEGLSLFDGSDYLYFHSGERGDHTAWGSRCFDYGNHNTLNYLLSNCKYWLEEYRFDGFRFDGVTSMMYLDHGLERDFLGYDDYFGDNVDQDAYIYLMLANTLLHQLSPNVITIAEDVSGMPGLATPVDAMGCGFDFRLSMGIADYWIKIIETQKDEDWWIGELFFQLTNSRHDEHTISYVESHDQAIVGDKTVIFRLIDSDMYNSMHITSNNLNVDRGVSLHKMARLFTISTANSGYLNFMGNEFGHPEWIDFPRAGNDWSYSYARRLWSLAANPDLRYQFLWNFDKVMVQFVKENQLHRYGIENVIYDDEKQLIIFKRSSYIFVFNFSAANSYTNYCFKAKRGNYSLVLDSDNELYGGFSRVDSNVVHFTNDNGDGDSQLSLYIPSRSTQIYKFSK